MDVSLRGLINNFLPQAPHILKTIVQAPLGWSPNARYQDWLTEIIVRCARPVLHSPAPLLKSQEFFCMDTGIWGHMWIAKHTIPTPVTKSRHSSLQSCGNHTTSHFDIEQALAFSIDILATHEDDRSCPLPPFNGSGVGVEWTSYRQDARLWSQMLSGLSEREIYDRILLEVLQGSDSPVILYAHGGAFCLMDPANHRHFAARLANNTNSRVLNVRYRLSPQHIFPAALMDMFLAYLSLLCPPPGSLHKAVPGNKIVLAGDSSGGNLVASLQVLLSTLILHGKTRILSPWRKQGGDEFITIPNPPTAALSLSSPWLDITRSLPSCTLNSKYDFIAPPEPLEPSLMSTSPLFPPDEIWPSKPVRTETYCEAVMCAHPLVSPLTTPAQVLRLFPAVYACTGWEGMTDETEVFVRRLAETRELRREGDLQAKSTSDDALSQQFNHPAGEVIFDGYIGMPHTFAFMTYNKAGVKADTVRATHIKKAVAKLDEDHITEKSTVFETRDVGHACWTNAKTMKETTIPFADLGMTSEFSGYIRVDPLTDKFMFAKVEEGRIFRVLLERHLREEEQTRETDKAQRT